MTLVLSLAAGLALFTALESFWGFRPRATRDHFLMDLKYLASDFVFNGIANLARLGIPMGLGWLTGTVYHGPMADQDLWAQFVIGILTLEFAIWFTHWCWHRFDLLYPFHAVHHASTSLYFLSGLRQHPVQLVGDQLFIALLTTLMGLRPEIVGVLVIVQMALALLTHANLNLRFGPLKYLFTSPRMHLLHHSVERRLSRRNLGGGLSLFDWIFGTAVDPDTEPVPARLGSADKRIPRGYWGQFADAFKRAAGSLR